MTATPDWEVAAEYFRRNEKTFADAVAWASEQSGLSREEILGRKKTNPVSGWRAMAMARCAHFGMSQPEIGRMFGMDHTTVCAAVKRVAELAESARSARSAVRDVKAADLAPHLSPGENKSR